MRCIGVHCFKKQVCFYNERGFLLGPLCGKNSAIDKKILIKATRVIKIRNAEG